METVQDDDEGPVGYSAHLQNFKCGTLLLFGDIPPIIVAAHCGFPMGCLLHNLAEKERQSCHTPATLLVLQHFSDRCPRSRFLV
jgi:hypothetical protein